MKNVLLILVISFFVQNVNSQKNGERDFKKHFDKHQVKGCFVLYDQKKNEYIRYNSALCDTGYIPASTFKIPHALIALEEEIVSDTHSIITWDKQIRDIQAWNQDQTLKTAIKYSCVWAFVGFAEQLGISKYYEYLDLFGYGNKDLTGPPTRFWLAGSLRISANEQVNFLRRFYGNEFSLSQESVEKVKAIIILDENAGYSLSGKTGGGIISDSKYIMWLVGYIVKDDTPYFYAMNFIADDFFGKMDARYDIAKSIFRELQLME